jgi:alkylation response protein AidB-like acyl-CoA dehydrogenase
MKAQVKRIFDERARKELDVLEDEGSTPRIKAVTGRYLTLLAEAGYLIPGVGPQSRKDIVGLMAIQEELAQISGSLFLSVEVTARMFAGVVRGFGDPSKTGEMTERVQRGQAIGAVAVSEPAKPGFTGSIYTRARADKDCYVVSGEKDFVTNGPIADYLAVFGRIEDKLAVFLVQPGDQGLCMSPRLKTLGYNGLAVCSLKLDEVVLSSERVLGPFDEDAALDFVRHTENLILCVASLGLMQRSIFSAKAHAARQEREGKSVIAHQEVRFKLAEMLTLLQSSQLLTYRAGWLYGNSDREAATLVHCAKVFTAEAAERVSGLAMQIMAGQGYLWGNPVERCYREAKYAALAGTTSERARMSIADDLLARYQ